MRIEEWDKCERFIFTLPKDLETLRIQWRILSKDRQTWRELVSLYKIIADERGLTVDREAMVNAIFSPKGKGGGKGSTNGKGNKGQGNGDKGENGGGSKDKEGGTRKRGGKSKNKNQDDGEKKSDKLCSHCGYRNHVEADCNRKKNGEPSAKDIKAALQRIKDEKSKPGSAAVAQADKAADIFGSLNATIFMASHNDDEFLIDSGASHHIVPNADGLVNVTNLAKPLRFNLAGSSMDIVAHQKGMLGITLSNGKSFGIRNIYIVRQARMRIFSYGLLAEEGWNLDYQGRTFANGPLSLKVVVRNVLPYVSVEGLSKTARPATICHVEAPLPPDVCATLARDQSKLYAEHCRLGHMHPDRIIELAEAGRIKADVAELKSDDFKLMDCQTCNRQKATNLPKGGISARGTKDGEMIHVDLAGPFEPSAAGNTYYLGIVADYTKARQIVPIKLKSEAFSFVIAFVKLLDRQSGVKVKVIRSDQGAEFGGGDNGSLAAKAFYTETGIIHQESPRYTPELNGVAERFNRTIKEMISAMVDGTPLGHKYWDHAGRYACAILNMSAYNDEGMNAWSTLTGRDPTIDNVREFGELVTAMVPSDLRKKSNFEQPRAELGRVIGMPAMASGYLVRFKRTGDQLVCRDIQSATLPLSTPLETPIRMQPAPYVPPAPRTVDDIIRAAPASRQSKLLEQSKDPNTPMGWAAAKARQMAEAHERSGAEPATRITDVGTNPSKEPTPVQGAEVTALSKADTSKTMDNAAAFAALAQHLDLDNDEPKSIKAALASANSKEWHAAIQAELDNLEGKGTWVETSLPKDRKAISCKWVLKRKRDANGAITKYKARLVARGFSQQPGIDFEETYAPVGRLSSLRILLAIVATLDLECEQADVEGAYLNGNLDRPIYMHYPEGMAKSKSSHTCLLLKKTLYGLKQSGREWWLVLGDKLVALGFTRCQSDWGLYVKKDDSDSVSMLVLVYVDNLLACAKTTAECNALFDSISNEWTITRLGEVKDILGMHINRDRAKRTLTISMGGYIDKLGDRFPIAGKVGGKYSPLPTVHVDDAPLLPSVTPYLEIVGSIQWIASSTRPDVAFAASFLGRYNAEPTQAHYELGLRVIRYLVSTRQVGLELGGKFEKGLVAYVDADWAGCLKTRRSTTGYVSYLFGGAINWMSRRQATVAASTMEAEYIAGAEASNDILWLRNLLTELGMNLDLPTVMRIDNQSAIQLASNPSTHARSKHIDIKHHILRERVDKGILELEYIESKKNRADILTKALSGPLHLNHLNGLRLVAIDNEDKDGCINAVIAKVSLRDRIRASNPLKERIDIAPPVSSLAARLSRNKPLLERIGDRIEGSQGKGKKDMKREGSQS
jgi:hypothetical protein